MRILNDPAHTSMSRPSVRHFLLVLLCATTVPALAQETVDVALVTDVQGQVTRSTPQGQQTLPAFVKLQRSDKLALDKGRLQIVYFANGRQEIWQGSGRIEILDSESKAAGLPGAEVRTLPAIVVRQIARTPSLDSQGRAGTVRLRSVPPVDAVMQLESSYRELRAQTPANDLTPEIFLLSGLSGLYQSDRIDVVIKDLQRTHPNDARVADLARLYQLAPPTVR